ncbi:hypothetical protein MKX03_028587, partial [Papaver bracteatum]
GISRAAGAGFAFIIRDYTGIPILAYSSAFDDDNISASSLEIDGVLKGLEIAQQFKFNNITMYCTRERVSDKVEWSLSKQVVKGVKRVNTATTLNLIREIRGQFATFSITYCGKFRNTSARYLARHGRGAGMIKANKLHVHGKLVDLLYENARGRTGIAFI